MDFSEKILQRVPDFFCFSFRELDTQGKIKMNNTKLVIPSCNDFMSIYGFDCEMDDVIQILKFEHGDERVNLSFDITVNSVRLLFYRNNILVFDLYREDLLELYLDENGDFLSFKLSDNFVITINFYPEISVFIR